MINLLQSSKIKLFRTLDKKYFTTTKVCRIDDSGTTLVLLACAPASPSLILGMALIAFTLSITLLATVYCIVLLSPVPVSALVVNDLATWLDSLLDNIENGVNWWLQMSTRRMLPLEVLDHFSDHLITAMWALEDLQEVFSGIRFVDGKRQNPQYVFLANHAHQMQRISLNLSLLQDIAVRHFNASL